MNAFNSLAQSFEFPAEIQRDPTETQASSQTTISQHQSSYSTVSTAYAVASIQRAATLQICLCYSPAVLCLPVSVFIFAFSADFDNPQILPFDCGISWSRERSYDTRDSHYCCQLTRVGSEDLNESLTQPNGRSFAENNENQHQSCATRSKTRNEDNTNKDEES